MENTKLRCILVVDDDEISNLVTRLVLNAANVADEIKVATNGKEAVAFMHDHQHILPELILLDVNMPLMDGFEFLEYCQQHNLVGDTKIAMYSTSIRTEDQQRARQYSDVIAYTEKPLTERKARDLLSLLSPNGQQR